MLSKVQIITTKARHVQSDLSGGLNWPCQAARSYLKVAVSSGPEKKCNDVVDRVWNVHASP